MSSASSRSEPTKRWSVDIYLYEDQDSTAANAVLRSDVPAPSTSVVRLAAAQPIRTCPRSVMRWLRPAP